MNLVSENVYSKYSMSDFDLVDQSASFVSISKSMKMKDEDTVMLALKELTHSDLT